MKEVIKFIIVAFVSLLIAITTAIGIYLIHLKFPDNPETAVILIAVYLFSLIVIPLVFYFLFTRNIPTSSNLLFYLLITISLALLSIYFYRVSSQILFPADILIWSETDFVTGLIKIANNYPFFTPEVLNESNNYTPGAPYISYLIGQLFGQPFSLPFYRTLHLSFALISSALAVLCVNLIIDLRYPENPKVKGKWWNALWFILLSLVATNSITNPYVQNLHNESLALLLMVYAYLLLILYEKTGKREFLWLMAVTPALGFWVKQYLAVWVILYTVYLLFFDSRRSFKRAVLFGLISTVLLTISMSIGYLVWKDDYIYWIFTVIIKHGNSPLRMLQNLLNVWPYAVLGLLCGLMIIGDKQRKRLLGLWVIWLLLFMQEIYTSGIAWMLHHMGPGSLVAGIWMSVALFIYWPIIENKSTQKETLINWIRVGILTACYVLLAQGLGFLRIPVDPLDRDAYRYVSEIEKEFSGFPSEKILLDAGSWLYIQDQVVMKDRAVSIGDRGFGGIGDFSGFIQRIENKEYDKILFRKYLAPDNWYDHAMWPVSSGINQALMDNYRVIRTIKPVDSIDNYLFAEISILVPK